MHQDIPIALKGRLVDDDGVAYREFRKQLLPRYRRVWRDIGAGYAAVVLVLAGLAIWDPGFPMAVVAVALGAVAVGYALAFINNFFHESAHHNLHPDRRRNDLLTNVLMGWLFGSSIQQYRIVHFQHHRALGTTEDSESSYFDPLRIRYLVAGLTGVKVLRTLRRYHQVDKAKAERTPGGAARSRLGWSLLAAVTSLTITAALWLTGAEVAGVTWLAGLLLAFPFFVSLRQLLEHRSEDADPDADYNFVDHGSVNRIFGDGPVASTMGSAGFNRHALHHWEPNLSYTRLPDLERWLLHTEAAPLVREQQTTYARTFLRLLEP
ncbi:MAG: fatty acid desaturase [Solirubrobacteraceae bacterium]